MWARCSSTSARAPRNARRGAVVPQEVRPRSPPRAAGASGTRTAHDNIQHADGWQVSESSPGPGGAVIAASPHPRTRSFRATADQVSEARRFLAQILGDCPLATDALACLSELATNSVLHSNSRLPGGWFIVRASVRQAGLRVEVEDEGGPWEQRQERDDQRGRGLVIVDALSSAWAITGDGISRITWFEIGSRAFPYTTNDRR